MVFWVMYLPCRCVALLRASTDALRSSSCLLHHLLQDGSYRFHARVAGSSGTDGTAGVTSFAIDSVAPTVTFEGEPGWQGSSRQAHKDCSGCVHKANHSMLR